MEEMDNIVVLLDEEGNEINFEYIDSVEHHGETYVVLLPADPQTEEEEHEVTILKLDVDETGEDIFVVEEDENLLDEVFDIFQQRMDEEYENE